MPGRDGRAATGVRAFRIPLAVAAVAVCAQISVPVPGSPVSQSLQTLAVVLVGALLGPTSGAVALGVYIALGAVGIPVFADGAAGVEHLWGPTAGYLVGFVVAAWFMGSWCGGRAGRRDFLPCLAGALIAHAIILGLGWMWLARLIGPGAAFREGVAPFGVGGVAKSVIAAGAWVGGRRLGSGRDPTGGDGMAERPAGAPTSSEAVESPPGTS